MDIKFYGGNCIKVSTKKVSITVDDMLKLNGKSVLGDNDILLITDERFGTKSNNAKFIADRPGEYEVSEVSIIGIPARSHLDSELDGKKSVIYKVSLNDMNLVILGNIFPEVSEELLEMIGQVDVLFVPIGGNGLTLDSVGAQKVIKEIDPKIVVPTHYNIPGVNYEIPQNDLSSALKSMLVEPSETVDVLKLKSTDVLVDGAIKYIVINPSKK